MDVPLVSKNWSIQKKLRALYYTKYPTIANAFFSYMAVPDPMKV